MLEAARGSTPRVRVFDPLPIFFCFLPRLHARVQKIGREIPSICFQPSSKIRLVVSVVHTEALVVELDL